MWKNVYYKRYFILRQCTRNVHYSSPHIWRGEIIERTGNINAFNC